MLGRIAGYELLELIGQGGMGVVYRARDLSLDKIVAVKILPDALARNPEYRERFLREARAEAKLSHPLIASCFAIGEADLHPPDLIPSDTSDVPLARKLYLTMEFIPGSDLSALTTGEPLEIQRVLDLTCQIATGLEVAHRAGVVHRDLKPANVRVTPDGRVKILDFGLATTIPTPDGDTESFITSRDHVMGTYHFMPPEQMNGRTTDPRSDLFSLGVVLYLLVTGKLPFTGKTSLEVMDAVRRSEPPPMARYANGVTDELERIVRKLLAKDVDSRYQSAHEVRTDLAQLGSRSGRRKDDRKSSGWHALLVATAALFVLLAGGLAWSYWFYRPWRSLAVVPFVNDAGDPRLDYLGQGVAAGVRALLIRTSGLSVAAASTVQEIPPEKRTPRNLAHELGVAATLVGSFDRRDGVPHLELELVEGRHGFVIWAGGYDYDVDASSDLERQVVRGVLNRVSSPFTGRRRLEPMPTKPLVSSATDLVRRAWPALDDPDDANGPERALGLLAKALEQDPDYALAWAARSRALWKVWNRDRTEESLALAEEAANRAVQLDPELPDARLARAQIYRSKSRYGASIRDLTEMLRVNANWDEAELHLAAAYRDSGLLAQAESHARHATQVRPLYWRNWSSLGYVLFLRGDYNGAREAYGQVIHLVPERNVGYTQLAAVEVKTGRYDAAIALYEKLSPPIQDGSIATSMGAAYFFTHRLEKAGYWFALATRLEPRNPTTWMNLGDLDVSAGRPDSARSRYVTASQLLDEQIHVNPGNIKLRVQRGLCLAKLGRCPDARAMFASVADSLLADNAELTHQLAKAYALCGRRDDALAAVRRAVALGMSPSVLRGDPELQAILRDPGFPAAPAHKAP